jgi:hypothetical protein
MVKSRESQAIITRQMLPYSGGKCRLPVRLSARPPLVSPFVMNFPHNDAKCATVRLDDQHQNVDSAFSLLSVSTKFKRPFMHAGIKCVRVLCTEAIGGSRWIITLAGVPPSD